MPENLEPLQAVATERYGLDLQGAIKRAIITSGNPADPTLEFEGLTRSLGVYPIFVQGNYDLMAIFLAASPAP